MYRKGSFSSTDLTYNWRTGQVELENVILLSPMLSHQDSGEVIYFYQFLAWGEILTMKTPKKSVELLNH